MFLTLRQINEIKRNCGNSIVVCLARVRNTKRKRNREEDSSADSLTYDKQFVSLIFQAINCLELKK